MPYTEFNPMGNPGDPGRTYMAAGQAQMSLMERAQAMKLREEARQMQQAKWNVEAPVMMAEAQSKLFEYGAQLKERQRTAGLYAEFAQNSDQMQSDFTDAMSTALGEDGRPDWDNTFRNIQNVRAKWNKYAMLPQAQGWFKNVDLEAKFAYDRAIINSKAQTSLDIANLRMTGKPSDRTGALTQEEIDEFEAQTGQPSGFKVGDVKRISRVPGAGIAIGEPALPYREPSAQGNVEFEKQYGKDLANRVSEVNISSQKASQAADNMLVDINTLEGLYEAGLTTGAGQEYTNMFGSVALRLGIGSKDRMATQEEAQRGFADMALNAASVMLKGQGQVTENERAMVERAVASAGNSPAANLAIMKTLRKAAQRAKEAGKYNIQLQRAAASGEIKTQEIPILMDEWYAQHSVGAEALEQIIAREARNSGGGEDTGTQQGAQQSTQQESALDYVKRIRQQRGAK